MIISGLFTWATVAVLCCKTIPDTLSEVAVHPAIAKVFAAVFAVDSERLVEGYALKVDVWASRLWHATTLARLRDDVKLSEAPKPQRLPVQLKLSLRTLKICERFHRLGVVSTSYQSLFEADSLTSMQYRCLFVDADLPCQHVWIWVFVGVIFGERGAHVSEH